MTDTSRDARAPLDVQVNSPGREGLTGTAPANLYVRTPDREEITIAPDFKPLELQPAWRRSFPIDWPRDRYVERRDFMKFMVLTSFALTVGQFWIGAQDWWRGRRGAATTRRVASVDDLAVGAALTFSYPEPHDICLLVRLADTEFVAYSQKCTHLSCAVIPRPAEGVLHCPCHEGFFDIRSGSPTAGPPSRPLPRILLDIRGREIYATGIEWRTA